jgi:hypothetical protein
MKAELGLINKLSLMHKQQTKENSTQKMVNHIKNMILKLKVDFSLVAISKTMRLSLKKSIIIFYF